MDKPAFPMWADDYRAAIARLRLSQVRAADFLGVSARKSRRWASGDYPVDKAAAMLLAHMIDTGTMPHDLDQAMPRLEHDGVRGTSPVIFREQKRQK